MKYTFFILPLLLLNSFLHSNAQFENQQKASLDSSYFEQLFNSVHITVKDNIDSAIAQLHYTINLAKSIKYSPAVCRGYSFLVSIQMEDIYAHKDLQQNIDSLTFYLNTSQNISPPINARCYITLGKYYSLIYYPQRSLINYKKALMYNEELRNDTFIYIRNYIRIETAVASTLINLKDFTNAKYYLENTVRKLQYGTFKDSLPILRYKSHCYLNLAKLFTHSKQLDSAKIYLDSTLYYAQKLGDSIDYFYGLITYATYYAKFNTDSAFYYLKKVQELDSSKVISSFYLGLHYFEVKDYKSAIKYLHTVKATFLYPNRMLEHILKIIAQSYEKLNQTQDAVVYYNQYIHLRDSLDNIENILNAQELETQLRTAEKDKEIVEQKLILQTQQAAFSRNKTIGIGILVFVLFISLFLYLFYKYRIKLQKNKLITLEKNFKLEQLQTRLATESQERNRIARDLHDSIGVLLSALAMNYQSLLKTNLPDKKKEELQTEGLTILQEASKEIRNIAHNLLPETGAHQNLISALQTLTDRLKSSETLITELHIYGKEHVFSPEASYTIYRMIEEIIQNTIKHAAASQLIIQLMFHDQELYISIQDNGVGFNLLEHQKGMGIQNIQQRAQEVNAVVQIHSERNKGTSIEISIPI